MKDPLKPLGPLGNFPEPISKIRAAGKTLTGWDQSFNLDFEMIKNHWSSLIAMNMPTVNFELFSIWICLHSTRSSLYTNTEYSN